jgi:hypothetical protein
MTKTKLANYGLRTAPQSDLKMCKDILYEEHFPTNSRQN